ncbi:uncharacterized protein MAM_02367 [Metarhizium album ARSEF 1941]|uniref:Uncharacterized protein n=1 Tax=Metarhizium album (strain ARSEF 1941) TaxID=1081103 RepID=A0A0B2X0W9_METAS|nr:uncharacterized protein MAM_02367 [Metarhizium album ARSEF 1941]KHN99514.1 hypothetical protein MAM_02367 [Metarhizium album ARSEF 1941]
MPDDIPRTSTLPQVSASTSKHPPAASNTRNDVTMCAKSTAFATGINPTSSPPGHAVRRSKTADEGSLPRRKSYTSRSEASLDGMLSGPARRGSNFSEYSLSEARDILNPRAQASQELPSPESSSLASLSLAFALLPAIAGALFKNGHSVITDVMLLGLSGVFLHWSVTQPWTWYHAAQQVRIHQEADAETAVEDDVHYPTSAHATRKAADLDNVPEEEEEEEEKEESRHQNNSPTAAQSKMGGDLGGTTPQQQAALRELHVHEVLALLSCFLLPPLSAYLLHHIRAQLSRPSEGLVSNYNLTIFLLISELRAFSHALKLVQSRTLHLQRVIHGNPFASPAHTGAQIEDVTERLSRLEARSLADEFVRQHSDGLDPGQAEQKATMARDVRNAIQPELDALNRAVRRYEKKATMLQYQTDSRFLALDSRMDDAIALAAVAAKNSSSKTVLTRATEAIVAILLLPFHTILQAITLPLRPLLALIHLTKKAPGAAEPGRATRSAKQSSPRYSGDRVPPRVMKR